LRSFIMQRRVQVIAKSGHNNSRKITLPAGVWMDRQQALAGLELRTLQRQAAPWLAPRR
jgi:hypothetical protein